MHWEIVAGSLLLMEQHFPSCLWGLTLVWNQTIDTLEPLIFSLSMFPAYCSLYFTRCCPWNSAAATCSEDIKNIFIEWNSKRLWRDRKYARKAKHSTELQADPETTEPELIFYGKDSGVVGLHRSELYCAVNEVKYLISGYDKVCTLNIL